MDTDKQKKIRRIVIIILILILLLIGSCSGWYLFRQNSVDFHVNQAEASLIELEELIAAKGAGEEVDEDLIEELISQIVEETEAALELADENSDPLALQETLDQINQLQTDTLETFNDALDFVEDETAVEALTDAITTTEEEQEQVETALQETETAIESGDETVVVDIETSQDPTDETVLDETVEGETVEGETVETSDTDGVLEVLEASEADETALEAVETAIDKKAEEPTEEPDPNGNGRGNRQ